VKGGKKKMIRRGIFCIEPFDAGFDYYSHTMLSEVMYHYLDVKYMTLDEVLEIPRSQYTVLKGTGMAEIIIPNIGMDTIEDEEVYDDTIVAYVEGHISEEEAAHAVLLKYGIPLSACFVEVVESDGKTLVLYEDFISKLLCKKEE